MIAYKLLAKKDSSYLALDRITRRWTFCSYSWVGHLRFPPDVSFHRKDLFICYIELLELLFKSRLWMQLSPNIENWKYIGS